MALSEASKEACFLSRFLTEMGLKSPAPMLLSTDNSGARDLSYNPEHHDRVKHIERRHFYVRELVEDHIIRVPYVNTHRNLADFFTKFQPPAHFFQLRDIIMNGRPSEVPPPGPRPRGGVEPSGTPGP